MSSGFGCMMIGPAGSGKVSLILTGSQVLNEIFQSTLCHALQEIGECNNRTFKVINLDPAAEVFKYRCDLDIRDMISVDDAQELMDYGPNGGLVYCMEYLIENIDEFMADINDFADESFFIFDCPG